MWPSIMQRWSHFFVYPRRLADIIGFIFHSSLGVLTIHEVSHDGRFVMLHNTASVTVNFLCTDFLIISTFILRT